MQAWRFRLYRMLDETSDPLCLGRQVISDKGGWLPWFNTFFLIKEIQIYTYISVSVLK